MSQTLYPSITASAVETPDKVNQFSIKRLGVLFKPSERLKEMINKAGVKLADKRIFQAETHPMKKIAKEK